LFGGVLDDAPTDQFLNVGWHGHADEPNSVLPTLWSNRHQTNGLLSEFKGL
jgi:hypothetical protein